MTSDQSNEEKTKTAPELFTRVEFKLEGSFTPIALAELLGDLGIYVVEFRVTEY